MLEQIQNIKITMTGATAILMIVIIVGEIINLAIFIFLLGIKHGKKLCKWINRKKGGINEQKI
jgi:hypothetical protein